MYAPRYREAKFKTALRVGFLYILDNFFCAPFVTRPNEHSQVINISIESSNSLLWPEKKFDVKFWVFLWETDKLNSMFGNYECGTHSKYQSFEFSLSVSQKHTQNFTSNFFSSQSRELELSIDILITYECSLGLVTKGAQKNCPKCTKILP